MEQGTDTSEKDVRLVAEQFPWELGVFDAHCHPTDTPLSAANIPRMKARVLTIMGTRAQDQDIVIRFQSAFGLNEFKRAELTSLGHPPCHVVPSFGWHPWFSHLLYDDSCIAVDDGPRSVNQITHFKSILRPPPEDDDFLASLPAPLPLSQILKKTGDHLREFPFALVGEVGLDRSFRIPDHRLEKHPKKAEEERTAGSRGGRRLSPYKVDLDHQRRVLLAQLQLAGELHRPASLHGVAAHGLLFNSLRETWKGHETRSVSQRTRNKLASSTNQCELHPTNGDTQPEMPVSGSFPPRICLHSYSGTPDTLRQYLHPTVPVKVFFSFSHLVNISSSTKAVDVIRAVPGDRILAESDLHAAGSDMDDLLEKIIRKICEIKGWPLDFGVKQPGINWVNFVFGQSE